MQIVVEKLALLNLVPFTSLKKGDIYFSNDKYYEFDSIVNELGTATRLGDFTTVFFWLDPKSEKKRLVEIVDAELKVIHRLATG